MFLLYFCQILGLTAVILPLATGPVFFTGVVVMVTTLALQIFIEWSPARAPSNALGTSINLKADEIDSTLANLKSRLPEMYVDAPNSKIYYETTSTISY